LDHPTSIKMLQKQNLKMENPVRGWHLATYNDLPLGWLKGVGDKFKNYYPTHLRIPD
jgi:NOL1/NOP2/fmu family ribosome biogenesis protein